MEGQKNVESEEVFSFLKISYVAMFKYWWEGPRRKDIIDSSYYYCPSPLGCADLGRKDRDGRKLRP